MDDLREVIARAIATADKTAVDPFLAEADAALAAIKQAGFVVVHGEPTEAMVQEVVDILLCNKEPLIPAVKNVYRAMIEASNAPT